MLHLFRIFIVGFCLLCFALGTTYNPLGKDNESDCGQYPIIENTTPSDSVLGAQSETDKQSIQNAQKANDIACSSLAAQRVAANAALRTFWLSVLGLTLIGFTLYETLRAGLLIAKQNEIALKTSILEYQPYIEIEGFKIKVAQQMSDTHRQIAYRIVSHVKYRNVGKTIARNVELCVRPVIENVYLVDIIQFPQHIYKKALPDIMKETGDSVDFETSIQKRGPIRPDDNKVVIEVEMSFTDELNEGPRKVVRYFHAPLEDFENFDLIGGIDFKDADKNPNDYST